MAAGGGAAVVCQFGAQICFRSSHGRRQAKQDAGKRRQRKRKSQHRNIDLQSLQERHGPADAVGHGSSQRADAEIGDNNGGHAGNHREQQTFRKKLPRDAASAGAQRAANGDFAGAACSLGQQHVGDVGAGDQQHKRCRAKRQQQHRPYRANNILAHGR